MSKNVAVFVDVANIFYAAKAAGVDIDYVTLLKAATAGRDFVRAYAYTGLDPENENQRQFHQFLARSGYKVVSKDIRKYGDGKVKANLDIELVVDLMKTARNLDVAVIVSGDGDFAPAIRAVQEMGVRCEVISFRGNTSSDLIEVADVFTDITQIARVEKSARSGRRVAAEGDLSMTEVPDKETEGAPRRRRRRTAAEREPAAVAESAVAADDAGLGRIIVLPGEKLSRVVPTVDEVGEPAQAAESAMPASLDGDDETAAQAGEAGRRRRRRRGGRGRGRGRGGEREAIAAAEPAEPLEPGEEGSDEDYVAPPRLPSHSTFGSVWDSQLGMPSSPTVASGAGLDEDEEEPEIPEYLLAERRQRGRGGQRGPRPHGRGRNAAYQAAIERERFGRSGTGGTSGGMGGGFGGARRDDRSRGGRPAGPPRRDRQPTPAPRPVSDSAEPWTEVPPEVEALLRAELAKRQAAAGAPAASAAPMAAVPAATETAETAAEEKPKRRTTRSKASAESAEA
ncbi:MAG TPA: NYN domain-containing protein [Candidatus Limnocylindrales bacterium]|nr:NYN domain-containing protein [Candidatus Limnocylindrales bacterium]